MVESRSSRNNPKRDWYIWRDPKPDGSPPNNWRSYFTPSAWEFDEATGQYYFHSFAVEQPDLNWANPEVREAIYDMMRFWLDQGIDGFRMDAIALLAKPEVFLDADNPDDIRYLANNPGVHDYLREMHDKVLKDYDIMTVGEVADEMPRWDMKRFKEIQQAWYDVFHGRG